MPEISIIIPVYNVEEFICECVDSILSQRFSDFEIILVDDSSPDKCPEICDEYARQDERIKVIHQKNGGLSNARNTGLSHARGKYVWFVDSDDFLAENALKTISEYFEDNPDIIKFNVLSYYLEKFRNKVDVDNYYSGSADNETVCRLINKACSKSLYPYVWRNVYRYDFLEKNELLFVDGLCYVEDGVFNSKAYLLAEKIIFLDERLYVYRYRENGLSKIVDKIFNEYHYESILLYDRIRDENYEKYCKFPSEEYYKDAGRFTLHTIYQYLLLRRVYACDDKHKYRLFKRVSKSELVQKAFRRFDINEIKSKSFDWRMFWFVKHKMYFLGHIICKYILYKK